MACDDKAVNNLLKTVFGYASFKSVVQQKAVAEIAASKTTVNNNV